MYVYNLILVIGSGSIIDLGHTCVILVWAFIAIYFANDFYDITISYKIMGNSLPGFCQCCCSNMCLQEFIAIKILQGDITIH